MELLLRYFLDNFISYVSVSHSVANCLLLSREMKISVKEVLYSGKFLYGANFRMLHPLYENKNRKFERTKFFSFHA